MLWLIGCTGMLGREFAYRLSEKKIPFVGTGSEVDIADAEKIEAFINKTESASFYASRDVKKDNKIDWIINCAAYTAVDKAEEETEKAYRTNCTGALNAARTARARSAKLVHISTDYVFDGKERTPYTEDVPKSPINAYGKTKAESEDLIAQAMTQYYIIRTSWLYGFGGRKRVRRASSEKKAQHPTASITFRIREKRRGSILPKRFTASEKNTAELQEIAAYGRVHPPNTK